jgi:hypothetical protein
MGVIIRCNGGQTGRRFLVLADACFLEVCQNSYRGGSGIIQPEYELTCCA